MKSLSLGIYKARYFPTKTGKTAVKIFYDKRIDWASHLGLAFPNVSFTHSLNRVHGAPALCQVC